MVAPVDGVVPDPTQETGSGEGEGARALKHMGLQAVRRGLRPFN